MEKYKEIWKIVDDMIFIGEITRIKIASQENTQKINKKLPSVYVDGAYDIINYKIEYTAIFVESTGEKVLKTMPNWEYDSEANFSLKNIYGELMAVEWAFKEKRSGLNLIFDYLGIAKYAQYEWKANNVFITE